MWKSKKPDAIHKLIDALHDVTPADIERMSDGVLKVVSRLMLNCHVIMSQEEDKRSLAKGKK